MKPIENSINSVSDHSADHIRNYIRDIRRSVKERLQQFDSHTHQKTEKNSFAESGGFVLGEWKQETEGGGHYHVEYYLPQKIAPPLQDIDKRDKVHGFIGMIHN